MNEICRHEDQCLPLLCRAILLESQKRQRLWAKPYDIGKSGKKL